MKKVLIADPNKANLVITCEILKEQFAGIQIYTTTTGQNALNILNENTNIDLAIIDTDLPDQNVYEFTLELHKNYNIPLIITTEINSFHQYSNSAQFKRIKTGIACIQKPLHPLVVQAICAYFSKNKDKYVHSELSQTVGGFGKIISKTKREDYFSIIIEEISLLNAKIKLFFEEKDKNSNDVLLIKEEDFKKILTSKKLNIYLPELFTLSNGLSVLIDTKVEKPETSSSDSRSDTIMRNYVFEIESKIINHTIAKDQSSVQLEVEFLNILCAKQLFDALMRGQAPAPTPSLAHLYF